MLNVIPDGTSFHTVEATSVLPTLFQKKGFSRLAGRDAFGLEPIINIDGGGGGLPIELRGGGGGRDGPNEPPTAGGGGGGGAGVNALWSFSSAGKVGDGGGGGGGGGAVRGITEGTAGSRAVGGGGGGRGGGSGRELGIGMAKSGGSLVNGECVIARLGFTGGGGGAI